MSGLRAERYLSSQLDWGEFCALAKQVASEATRPGEPILVTENLTETVWHTTQRRAPRLDDSIYLYLGLATFLAAFFGGYWIFVDNGGSDRVWIAFVLIAPFVVPAVVAAGDAVRCRPQDVRTKSSVTRKVTRDTGQLHWVLASRVNKYMSRGDVQQAAQEEFTEYLDWILRSDGELLLRINSRSSFFPDTETDDWFPLTLERALSLDFGGLPFADAQFAADCLMRGKPKDLGALVVDEQGETLLRALLRLWDT